MFSCVTLLSAESPNQVHIWCHAHVLNLVLGDTTGVVVASASLFSLLNDVAVFIRESYKRMCEDVQYLPPSSPLCFVFVIVCLCVCLPGWAWLTHFCFPPTHLLSCGSSSGLL